MLGTTQAALLAPNASAAPPKVYATFDISRLSSGATLSNGNLTIATVQSAGFRHGVGSVFKSMGIWTAEFLFVYKASVICIGAAESNIAKLGFPTVASGYSGGINSGIWNFYWNASTSSPPGPLAMVAGNYIGVKMDLSDANNVTLKYWINGVYSSVSDATRPRKTTGASYAISVASYYDNTITVNYGATPFQYPILGNGLDGMWV